MKILSRLLFVLTAMDLASSLVIGSGVAKAAPPPYLRESVATCDPNNPKNCGPSFTVTTVDHSGTITVGGTAQNAMTTNTVRKGWCIQNLSTATESLFINTAGTASATTGTELTPGQQACNISIGSFVDTGNISVFAATTGHAFLAWEKQ